MKTKQEVAKHYDINVRGTITSLGKFEGEPWWVPVLWGICMEGFADDDNGRVFTIRTTKQDATEPWYTDVKQWLGRKRVIRLRESDQGFVTAF